MGERKGGKEVRKKILQTSVLRMESIYYIAVSAGYRKHSLDMIIKLGDHRLL